MPRRTGNYSRGTEHSEIWEKIRVQKFRQKPTVICFCFHFFFLKARRPSRTRDTTAWKQLFALWVQCWLCDSVNTEPLQLWQSLCAPINLNSFDSASSPAQHGGTALAHVKSLNCGRSPHKTNIKLLPPGSYNLINITIEKYILYSTALQITYKQCFVSLVLPTKYHNLILNGKALEPTKLKCISCI